MEIGRGIILDFYKEFEIVEDFGEPHTGIVSFEYHGKTMYKNTDLGQKIYKIKNLKNPPISQEERDNYINEFVAIFEPYTQWLRKRHDDIKLTCIPSGTKIPDDISCKLSQTTGLELVKIVDKNPEVKADSKNTHDFVEALESSQKKYIFNDLDISNNPNSTYLIIDDVIGNGSSIATVLKKLYDTTNGLNYFLILAKDVKRWIVCL